MAPPNAYSHETYDCFGDCAVCMQVYYFGPLAIPVIASKIGAEDTHNCENTIKSCFATNFLPCGIICCYDHIYPCYLSRLLDRSMQFHNITIFPSPCGGAKVPVLGCYWQMCCTCTSPCTMCVMYREASQPVRVVSQPHYAAHRPYGATNEPYCAANQPQHVEMAQAYPIEEAAVVKY